MEYLQAADKWDARKGSRIAVQGTWGEILNPDHGAPSWHPIDKGCKNEIVKSLLMTYR